MLLRLSHEIINYAIAPDKQRLYFVSLSKHPTLSKKKNGINALKYNSNRGGPVFLCSQHQLQLCMCQDSSCSSCQSALQPLV